MPNRKRTRQVCLRLTEEEFALFQQRCSDSGLSQTDFLVSVLNSSTVKIYRIEEAIKPLISELRHIGANINQLAYFSNIGHAPHQTVGCAEAISAGLRQESKVRFEIESIRRRHNLLMEEISEFLKHPKFAVDVR